MKNADRLHEKELGQINPDIKNVKLSEKTENILSGKHDNEPLNPETQPILYKMNSKIKLIIQCLVKNYLSSIQILNYNG